MILFLSTVLFRATLDSRIFVCLCTTCH